VDSAPFGWGGAVHRLLPCSRADVLPLVPTTLRIRAVHFAAPPPAYACPALPPRSLAAHLRLLPTTRAMTLPHYHRLHTHTVYKVRCFRLASNDSSFLNVGQCLFFLPRSVLGATYALIQQLCNSPNAAPACLHTRCRLFPRCAQHARTAGPLYRRSRTWRLAAYGLDARWSGSLGWRQACARLPLAAALFPLLSASRIHHHSAPPLPCGSRRAWRLTPVTNDVSVLLAAATKAQEAGVAAAYHHSP